MVDIDVMDRRILLELDANARIPSTLLGKRLRISRERVDYRIKRMEEQGVIRKFVAMIDPARFGYGVYKMFFKFQNLKKEDERRLVEWLVENPYIYWVATAKGRWDLNITVFARDISHFDSILGEFTSKFGTFIQEQEFNTTLNVGIAGKQWLLPEKEEEAKPLVWYGVHENQKIDELEFRIMRAASNQGRANATELARQLKISPRTVAYRMRRLEKNGIILGYSVSVDYEKLDVQFFKANVYFNVLTPAAKKKIVSYCRSNPHVIYYIFCVGSWPLELEIVVKDNRQFYEVMDGFRKQFPEMRGYDTLIFPKEHKFEWMPQKFEVE